ncbi:hypothetical protein [Streptomyces caniscabiei]|uniref:hypothetical protein n=1 Tax=Streptomyces caniscabiei TaxID=2746961 RepID=UPI0029AFCF23|nr:hypothetical protein [Streptomyces caniscabiei]MDX2954549.1 hypothetical protein [Streptomyces caniscabiei]
MRIVSAAKHAALQAGYKRTLADLEAEKKRNAEHQGTITRLRAELDQQRDRKPDSPVQNPKQAVGDAELRRQLNLANRTIREQGAQLERLQDSHIADTKELHDLRQGGRSEKDAGDTVHTLEQAAGELSTLKDEIALHIVACKHPSSALSDAHSAAIALQEALAANGVDLRLELARLEGAEL